MGAGTAKGDNMNRFVITDPHACIGCRTCEVACSLAHPDAEDGVAGGTGGFAPDSHFGASFHFYPRIKTVTTKYVSSTVQCRHCDDAPCVNVCPTHALVYDGGSVQLVSANCIGCKTCVIACPFGAMSMVSKPASTSVGNGFKVRSNQTYAHKCDLCAGIETGPSCITACPTKALHLMAPNSIEDLLRSKRERAINNDPSAGAAR